MATKGYNPLDLDAKDFPELFPDTEKKPEEDATISREEISYKLRNPELKEETVNAIRDRVKELGLQRAKEVTAYIQKETEAIQQAKDIGEMQYIMRGLAKNGYVRVSRKADRKYHPNKNIQPSQELIKAYYGRLEGDNALKESIDNSVSRAKEQIQNTRDTSYLEGKLMVSLVRGGLIDSTKRGGMRTFRFNPDIPGSKELIGAYHAQKEAFSELEKEIMNDENGVRVKGKHQFIQKGEKRTVPYEFVCIIKNEGMVTVNDRQLRQISIPKYVAISGSVPGIDPNDSWIIGFDRLPPYAELAIKALYAKKQAAGQKLPAENEPAPAPANPLLTTEHVAKFAGESDQKPAETK